MKTFCILLSMLVLGFFACKKGDSVPEDPGKKKGRIHTITRPLGPASVPAFAGTVTYDDEGRMLTYIVSNQGSEAYEYGPAVVKARLTNPGGFEYGYNLYYLNQDGLADSVDQYMYDHFYYGAYRYNEDGYVTSFTLYNEDHSVSYIYEYTYANGNCIRQKQSFPGTSMDKVVKYGFDLAKPNSITNENMGQRFLGKSNSNLVIADTTTIQFSPTEIFTYLYSQTADGKVTSRQTLKDGNVQYNTFYTYY